ncbi:MAG TPA: hypothetical protein VHX18_13705 [Rhizomicrobium sp.]|jgi:hypothetical protein|nr:hypothetical protein [Rhizomicrobium sp.]
MVLEPFHAGNSTRLAGTDFSGGLHGPSARLFRRHELRTCDKGRKLVALVKELNFSNLLEGLTPDPSLAGAGPASLG